MADDTTYQGAAGVSEATSKLGDFISDDAGVTLDASVMAAITSILSAVPSTDPIEIAVADDTKADTTSAAATNLISDAPDGGYDLVTINAAAAENYIVNTATANNLDAQALVLGADTSIQAIFGSEAATTVLVTNGGTENVAQFQGNEGITIQASNNAGATYITGTGADNVVINGGTDVNVVTGGASEGEMDQVLLTGGDKDTTINVATGSGASKVTIDKDLAGAATVNGGSGFDQLRMNDNPGNHTFEVVKGKFVMHSNADITITGENVMVWGETLLDQPDPFQDITIFASSAGESIIAKLYQVALGRTALDGQDGINASDSLGGLEFWTEHANTATSDLAVAFLDCAEFHNKYDNLTDSQYVQTLFNNLGVATTADIAGKSLQNYVDLLGDEESGVTRYDVAYQIAASQEAVDILGQDGSNYVIDLYDFVNDNIIS